MPYPDWLSYSKSNTMFMSKVFECGKNLAICVSVEKMYNYINCWDWIGKGRVEESVCLFKHFENMSLEGIDYTMVGINSGGLYYGEKLFSYLKENGSEAVKTFSNLWVIRGVYHPLPVFVVRLVDATKLVDIL